MTGTPIDVRHLERLPDLCVKKGIQAETTKREEFGNIPDWPLLIASWDIAPVLIQAIFTRRRLWVDLPVSKTALRQFRLAEAIRLVGLLLGVSLLVASLLISERALTWAGGLVFLISLIGGVAARRLYWVSGRLKGDVLWLYGVHPSFSAEIQNRDP